MFLWRALHRGNWWIRRPVQCGVLALTILLVMYPYPGRLVTHMRRWRNPAALINPDSPALQPLLDTLRTQIPSDLPAKKKLRIIEEYVCSLLPYAWDWDTWGVADYIPTVEEALERGQEDCDGRAVVAASLLKGLGHEATIISDWAHVWVRTEVGETMNPGRQAVIVASDAGVRVQWWNPSAHLRSILYGLAVFPLYREVIVLTVLWMLIVVPGTSWRRGALIALLLLDALLRLRVGGRDPDHPIRWLLALALIEAGIALVLALVAASRAKPVSATASPPESPA